jgi:uncharacterized protein YktA (UPF0223 family)
MSMSITRLTTHWSAEEAYTVIAFLDALRDQLWETYGEQINEMFQAETERYTDDRQIEMPFDDEIDF